MNREVYIVGHILVNIYRRIMNDTSIWDISEARISNMTSPFGLEECKC